ncbi:hypothetical protein J5U18_04630 [Sphingobacteriaceae bacterium WQ 2009]|uniref:Uncharacterized protein n=1 Tax=Rhinopithecimicrobium faecis TaxID=2820698 RepID=A0A8T4H7V0_9SPHI|nr:hypothetical protein [Sphingobacteriaceae bacterium WQ 2009]
MNDLFAALYENNFIGFYSSGFSEEIFDEYLYQKYGVTLVISVSLLLCIYYKIMDKPRFAKLKYWVSALFITVIINFTFLWTNSEAILNAKGFSFDGEYMSLAFVNALYAAILFFLFSLVIKRLSVNNSKIPF